MIITKITKILKGSIKSENGSIIFLKKLKILPSKDLVSLNRKISKNLKNINVRKITMTNNFTDKIKLMHFFISSYIQKNLYSYLVSN